MALSYAALTSVQTNSRPQLMSQRMSCTDIDKAITNHRNAEGKQTPEKPYIPILARSWQSLRWWRNSLPFVKYNGSFLYP